jgi:RNA-directed DNA polymerase
MTTMTMSLVGAPSAALDNWEAINWHWVERSVRRLQMRIAKAIREGKKGKAKALQWLLTHSYQAKLLAVRRVVQNRGGKSPGIDNVVWRTPRQKVAAARSLKRHGYKPQPLKRIYIPKKKGKRPLSIPTLKDRAMQALHLLALEPVSETKADKNSYGFRTKRSTADAIAQCYIVLARKHSAQWVLEGDIKACFDRICHNWLLDNIPMDKLILRKWLKAGYMEEGSVFPTTEGTPQGGIASPALANITLDGMEEAIKEATCTRDKVNFVRYADDFIVSGASKEVLEEKVMPTVVNFLRVRGLELSLEKTKITHIEDGFDFLGFNVRKYKGKFLTKPSKESVKSFLADIRDTIKSNQSIKTACLLMLLNPKIRGWTNYYRHAASKRTFGSINYCILRLLQQWGKRRHPKKNVKWVQNKYFRTKGINNWIFSVKLLKGYYDLVNASDVTIVRHIKIRGIANPYDPAFTDYFRERERSQKARASKMGEKRGDT